MIWNFVVSTSCVSYEYDGNVCVHFYIVEPTKH
uniref:Uncharacterized protein n=1 Tax=Rhizophora mucronata TaxID=61149 RepID=A0A2P2QC66_RHIMU